MKRGRKTLWAAAFSAAAISVAGCGNVKVIQWLQARDHINKGVNAFKNAAYPQAVEHFERAVKLDPTLLNAKLYLGTAYMQQFVPGAESEENVRNAEAAANVFQEALKQDPNSQHAIESLGSLSFNQKKLDEAKAWYRRLLQVNDKKKEAYYTIGVIDWTKSYQPRMEVRAKIGMRPEEPGPIKDKKAREELKAQNGEVIREGIEMLEKALALDPDYDDAMAYMNLMYRERADVADTVEENKQDTAVADRWVQKTLETKKRKTERPVTATKNG